MKSIKRIHPQERESASPETRVAPSWSYLASYPAGIVVLEADVEGRFVGIAARCASLPFFRFILRSSHA